MEHVIRNARRRLNGDIDVDLFVDGNWLPFTAREGDPGDAGSVWLQANTVAAPADSEAEQLAALSAERAGMIVSRFQARAALHLGGLLDQAEAAVAEADPIAQIAWRDAQEWRRYSPTIAAIAAALGLVDEQIDDLFRAAAQITA